MSMTQSKWGGVCAILFLTFFLWPATIFGTDGHFLHGAGPVNEAMGGADTGLCLDATGSIAWNPACTTNFLGKRLEFHGTLFDPWRSLSSTVDANAFGPGMPGETLSGTTVSKRDMSVMPGFAFIDHPKGSSTVYYIAMLAVSGFGVDYAASTNLSNPILSPQQPNGFGFGHLRSNYMLVTIPIGVAHRFGKKLSLGTGFSLTPALSMLQVDPAPFAVPVTAGNNGYPYYLSAHNNATAYGAGFQAGAQYKISDRIGVGLSYHSPIWLSDFKWDRADLTGAKHTFTFRMDLPQLISMGVGITPSRSTRIGVDARWFNYANTAGFSGQGFRSNGSVAGFGWTNIWAIGGGVQQQVARSLKLMVGYNFTQNPVPAALTFFNIPAPAIVQHHLTSGLVRTVGKWDVNLSYYHAFENSITGPWYSPAMGAIPGTSVTSRMHENSGSIGLARTF